MASDGKEIEVKIKIDKKTYDRLYDELSKISKYFGKTEQTDDYYSPIKEKYTDEKYPFKWLSIRSRGNVHILNYKHFYPEGAEKHDYCDEYETTLSNPEKMDKIFNELGIGKLICVKKIRHKFILNDEFEVLLDSVDKLGYFIEIESIMKETNVEIVRNEIMKLVEKLRLEVKNIDYRGYPYELMKKKGLL